MMKLIIIVDYVMNHYISSYIGIAKEFDIEIIDISQIKYPTLKPQCDLNVKITSFRDYNSAIDYIKSLNNVFILCIFGFEYKSLPFFRAIPKKTPLIYLFINGIPINRIVKKNIFAYSYSDVFNFIFSMIPLWMLKIRYPDIVLFDGKQTLNMQKRLINKNTKLVNIHSVNCDDYINEYKCTQTRIVFIDENVPEHSDNDLLSIKNYVTPFEYYSKMNLYFEQIETEFKIPVTIACHPKSSLSDIQLLFKGRDVIKGCTAELIKEAKLILAHSSTAIGIAAFMYKPIILITTNQIDKNISTANCIYGYSTELGVPVINIDNSLEIPNTTVNLCKYDNYIKNYMWNMVDHRPNSIIFKDALLDFINMRLKP